MVLQSFVRTRAVMYEARQRAEMLPEPTHASVDVFKMVPVWLSCLFPDHVREYVVSDLAGRCGRLVSAGSSQTFLDLPRAVGLGLHAGPCAGLDCTIQLWLLQPDADLAFAWTDCNGTL